MSMNGKRAYANEYNWDKFEPFFLKLITSYLVRE